MNEKDVVSGGKGDVECHEKGGKVGKNADQKTHNGNNLAKLNDAKCTIHTHVFDKKAFEEQGKICVLQVLRPLKMLELSVWKHRLVNK